jgi:hypothetical protein
MIYHEIAGNSLYCPEQSYFALILTNISEPSFEKRSPDHINFVLCAVLINSYEKKCSALRCCAMLCDFQERNPSVKRSLTVFSQHGS